MKLNFGFGLHAIWRDRNKNLWLEFHSFNNDNILSAICISNPSSIRKDNKKASYRILKSLGVYKNE